MSDFLLMLLNVTLYVLQGHIMWHAVEQEREKARKAYIFYYGPTIQRITISSEPSSVGTLVPVKRASYFSPDNFSTSSSKRRGAKVQHFLEMYFHSASYEPCMLT